MLVSIPLERARLLPDWSLVDYIDDALAKAGLPAHTRHAVVTVLQCLHPKNEQSIDPLINPLIITAAVSIAPHKEQLIRTLALLF